MNPLADFYGMAGMPRIAKEETGTTHLANGMVQNLTKIQKIFL